MALKLRELHNREIQIPFSVTEINKETNLEEVKTIKPTFRLDMSEVDSEATIFSFLVKIHTRTLEDPVQIISIYKEMNIKISVRMKNPEDIAKEKGEYSWSQAFPRFNDTGKSTSIEVMRDMILCKNLSEIITIQYNKDNAALDSYVYKEFENFQ